MLKWCLVRSLVYSQYFTFQSSCTRYNLQKLDLGADLIPRTLDQPVANIIFGLHFLPWHNVITRKLTQRRLNELWPFTCTLDRISSECFNNIYTTYVFRCCLVMKIKQYFNSARLFILWCVKCITCFFSHIKCVWLDGWPFDSMSVLWSIL